MTDPANSTAGPDRLLIAALHRGDESAFETLVNQYASLLARIARLYLNDPRLVEEVIQETWIAVLRGLDKFEGRSSLKTWLLSILINKAKTIARHESRYRSLFSLDDELDSPADWAAVPPERFNPPEHPRWPGHWALPPSGWDAIPEERLLSSEIRSIIQQVINTLPAYQRAVITLRDIEHWSSEEVCNALAISETNQRVLLHRARSKVRAALEQYLNAEG